MRLTVCLFIYLAWAFDVVRSDCMGNAKASVRRMGSSESRAFFCKVTFIF